MARLAKIAGLTVVAACALLLFIMLTGIFGKFSGEVAALLVVLGVFVAVALVTNAAFMMALKWVSVAATSLVVVLALSLVLAPFVPQFQIWAVFTAIGVLMRAYNYAALNKVPFSHVIGVLFGQFIIVFALLAMLVKLV